ncbi:hypothetical protein PAAG_05512 [Paracoccidioides lutzii Pb01]|uniref:Uncharacterized protein n=1 Tax=Paracoccidioides lutzii (strain ATCC MYA-826 / Pb01) TaxID=502779 RepID=C1H419_PARBA|nr:hypothetical protein PAAG_05512 [Paracoccidioides lutzii Pb01]EEH34463.2 hypothetical protein PAAG_05512 [Paracoccidioides lutzii Pb01]
MGFQPQQIKEVVDLFRHPQRQLERFQGRPPLLSYLFLHVKRASSFVPTLRAPPPSPSEYTGSGSPDVNEEGVVEIAVIPWGANGPYQLTINLALFRFRHTGSF